MAVANLRGDHEQTVAARRADLKSDDMRSRLAALIAGCLREPVRRSLDLMGGGS